MSDIVFDANVVIRMRLWAYNAVASGRPDRYYDDNGGMLIALLEAYNLTNREVYLERVKEVLEFMLAGEDDVQGGGIPQREYTRDRK